jgi:hypothetical protein
MSYQPYPSGGSNQAYPAGGNQLMQQGPQPATVRNAVWLMYGGAAVSVISIILVLAFSARFRRAVLRGLATANAKLRTEGKTPLTATQMHSAASLYLAVVIIVLVIVTVLWVWMAWANNRGKGWARIVSTVLFVLDTLYLVASAGRGGLAVIVAVLGWLCGLGAIVFLWQRKSTAYLKSSV